MVVLEIDVEVFADGVQLVVRKVVQAPACLDGVDDVKVRRFDVV